MEYPFFLFTSGTQAVQFHFMIGNLNIVKFILPGIYRTVVNHFCIAALFTYEMMVVMVGTWDFKLHLSFEISVFKHFYFF